MTLSEYSLKFVKLSRYATSFMSYIRDKMNRFLTGIDEDLEKECRAAVLHDIMDLSRLMVHIQFMKGLFHQGELSSSKGHYDKDSEPRVKRNNEVDTPQERPPCRNCGKLHGGECMMGTNTCYCCGKPGHTVNNCPNRISQEQRKERVQPNGQC
ncbi:uncharacterized protein LOC107030241 [Solanum pennellii]|uniref:Uncharacterized protein LOC107030241 n=1 Tax=Solanum pennellii TaxID=28526 RepID=A0ABM1HL44_SOLPN|nr:uncharacterized protein LOC107030241 [Solanum pennellii]